MKQNLVFLHVPKTGGSTLRSVILRQYSSRKVFDRNDTGKEEGVKSIEAFGELPHERRKEISCVVGHGPFGIHEELIGHTEYVTLLRDPVDRNISLYYYVRRSKGHRFHQVAQKMKLQEFIKSDVASEVRNAMAKQVAGYTYSERGENVLDKAKSNLTSHFGVVGVTEQFDESLVLMKKRYGWGRIGYKRRNVSKERPSKEDLPQSAIEAIRERNQIDLQLYKYARKRLQSDLKKINVGKDVLSLKIRCWLRTKWGAAKKQAKKVVGRN